MKKKIITFMILLCVINVFGQMLINTKNNLIINYWKYSILENINYQLNLLKSNRLDFFYTKKLLNERQNLIQQKDEEGFRNKFISLFQTHPDLFTNAVIIENYKSGESFKGTIYFISFDKQTYLRELELVKGNWKLIGQKKITNIEYNSILKSIKSINKYFCNDAYLEEYLIMTWVINNKFSTKTLFFPCSNDFKKIKKMLNTQVFNFPPQPSR